MSRECNHPTCGETCRRPKKEKKIYRLRPYAVRRMEENKIYNAEAKEFKINNPICAINSPVCIKRTQGVNHKKGRGDHLMDKDTWEPACNPCNQYCEDNTQWAIDNGHKESRLAI
jgi:hypothetical protein